MKTIIAGGREITDYTAVHQAVLFSNFEITEVVSGKAAGVDTLGEQWAIAHNIPIKEFPANWAQYHKAAGAIRNRQMGDYAEALIAVWNGKFRGTKHLIEYATKKGLKVYVHLV